MSSSVKKRLRSVRFHFLTILLGLIMIYPLVWLLMSSFKSNRTMFQNTFSLWPTEWDILKNYQSGWSGVSGIPFGKFILNTLIVDLIGTAGCVVFSVMAAYAFARIQFVGRKFWFTCCIITMLIPSQVMVVPQYIIFKKMGLINTLISLALPWFFGTAFFVFLIMQFIRGLPIELDEAAEIDGCSRIGIFFRIIFPLTSPAIVTSTIFSFYWIWQDFFQPLVFISKPQLYTVSLALNLFLDPNSLNNYGGLFAMSIISLIPVIAIFLIFQKYLVEGIATTGMKN